jgi:hypothetical protein
LELVIKFLFLVKKVIQGKSPARLAVKLLEIRSRSPQTFNEKILYKMAHDRRDLLTLVADKLTVRDYVRSKIGDKYLTEVLGVYKQSSEVNIERLPKNFVLKPNHASGAALIVAEFVPTARKLDYTSKQIFKKYYVNSENLLQNQITSLVNFWLDTDYYAYHRTGYPEWAYRGIDRAVYAEELLSENGQPPQDYRFLIFNGRCSAIMVDTPGYGGVKRDIYTPNWERIEVAFGWGNSDRIHERPTNLSTMIELAETLGEDFDHIRIDFYNVDGRIVFGEMTNYHAGGTQKFVPARFDRIIGSEWKPETIY